MADPPKKSSVQRAARKMRSSISNILRRSAYSVSQGEGLALLLLQLLLLRHLARHTASRARIAQECHLNGPHNLLGIY